MPHSTGLAYCRCRANERRRPTTLEYDSVRPFHEIDMLIAHLFSPRSLSTLRRVSALPRSLHQTQQALAPLTQHRRFDLSQARQGQATEAAASKSAPTPSKTDVASKCRRSRGGETDNEQGTTGFRTEMSATTLLIGTEGGSAIACTTEAKRALSPPLPLRQPAGGHATAADIMEHVNREEDHTERGEAGGASTVSDVRGRTDEEEPTSPAVTTSLSPLQVGCVVPVHVCEHARSTCF